MELNVCISEHRASPLQAALPVCACERSTATLRHKRRLIYASTQEEMCKYVFLSLSYKMSKSSASVFKSHGKAKNYGHIFNLPSSPAAQLEGSKSLQKLGFFLNINYISSARSERSNVCLCQSSTNSSRNRAERRLGQNGQTQVYLFLQLSEHTLTHTVRRILLG